MLSRTAVVAWSLLSAPTLAADVSLIVSGDDHTATLVREHLSAALRSDGVNLVAVETPANFHIDVVAVVARNSQGHQTGVALSVVAMKAFDNSPVLELASARTKRQIDALTSRLETLDTHWIEMGGLNDVEQICRDIAAAFRDRVLRKAPAQ